MKRKVIMALMTISVTAVLIGCTSSSTAMLAADIAPQSTVVEIPEENQEIIDNLKQMKAIIESERQALETISDDLTDMKSSEAAFDKLLTQISGDTASLTSIPKTGNDSIDKTYDAAVYYNKQLIDVVASFKEVYSVLKDKGIDGTMTEAAGDHFLDAIEPVKNLDSSQYATEEQEMDAMYASLKQFYSDIVGGTYPAYCQSRVDNFARKIQYFMSVIEEAYFGIVYNDPLREVAANNISDRVATEFSNSSQELLATLETQIGAETEAAEEINLVYDEIIANTDLIINALEGGE